MNNLPDSVFLLEYSDAWGRKRSEPFYTRAEASAAAAQLHADCDRFGDTVSGVAVTEVPWAEFHDDGTFSGAMFTATAWLTTDSETGQTEYIGTPVSDDGRITLLDEFSYRSREELACEPFEAAAFIAAVSQGSGQLTVSVDGYDPFAVDRMIRRVFEQYKLDFGFDSEKSTHVGVRFQGDMLNIPVPASVYQVTWENDNGNTKREFAYTEDEAAETASRHDGATIAVRDTFRLECRCGASEDQAHDSRQDIITALKFTAQGTLYREKDGTIHQRMVRPYTVDGRLAHKYKSVGMYSYNGDTFFRDPDTDIRVDISSRPTRKVAEVWAAHRNPIQAALMVEHELIKVRHKLGLGRADTEFVFADDV